MCFPWFCSRHCQSKAKKKNRSYKGRKGFKLSYKFKLVPSEDVILLVPKPTGRTVSRNLEYALLLPRLQVCKMGDTSHFRAPLSEAYVTAPNRQNTKSCDCPGCHHPKTGEDPLDVEGETTPELQTWSPDLNYSLPNHQARIGPAFLVNSDLMGSRPRLDLSGLDPKLMSYAPVYVCPRSAAHISFPIIDYSTSLLKPGTSWPHFYMAIAPKYATLMDLRTTLTPKGSGTLLTARSLADGSTTDISSFSDIFDLRCKIIQLEIVDIPEREKSENNSEKGKTKEKVKPDVFGFPGFSAARTSGSKRRDGWKKK